MDPAAAIRELLTGNTAGVTAFLGAISLIGVVTMALIQAAKDATPVRDLFQRVQLRKWLAQGARDARAAFDAVTVDPAISWPDGRPTLDVGAAEQALLVLAINGDRKAMYDLSIEQMCVQINTAVQMVIDYPGHYPSLLLIIASRADVTDLSILLAHDAGAATAPATAAAPHVTYTEAKSRVAHQLQRAVDGFQVSASFRWKWMLQIASFAISALLAAAALLLNVSMINAGPFAFVLEIAGIAILAGFLAPVARDLIAALQKLRTT